MPAVRRVLAPFLTAILAITTTSACHPPLPRTSSEMANGSSYIPLSPKPVHLTSATAYTSHDLLDALPNVTMRISTGTTDHSANLSYGAGAIGEAGHSYEVIVDYLLYTTAYLPVCYSASVEADKGKFVAGSEEAELWTAFGRVREGSDTRAPGAKNELQQSSKFSMAQRIPVYIGAGLRIQANVHVNKGTVQLSLFGIGSAAEAGNVSGTMVIQTLGIFGKSISPLIPLPSDVSQGSIQAALQALAAIKAKLYDDDGVKVDLQIVGYEATLRSVNAIRLIDATLAGSTVSASLVGGKIVPELIGDKVPDCGP